MGLANAAVIAAEGEMPISAAGLRTRGQATTKFAQVVVKSLVRIVGKARMCQAWTYSLRSDAGLLARPGIAFKCRQNSKSFLFRWPGPLGSVAEITISTTASTLELSTSRVATCRACNARLHVPALLALLRLAETAVRGSGSRPTATGSTSGMSSLG